MTSLINNIWALPIPKESYRHEFIHVFHGEDIIRWYKNPEPIELPEGSEKMDMEDLAREMAKDEWDAVNVDGGNWRILFTSDTATDEECAKVVERIFDEQGMPGFKHYHSEDHVCSTARASFASLLRSHNLNGRYLIIEKMD